MAVKTLSRDRNIEHWDAEDVEAWDAGGAKVAKRNLIWSIFAEHVGFSIWSIWSVMVLFMPQATYHIDAGGKVLPGGAAHPGRGGDAHPVHRRTGEVRRA